jgi:SAM-dependent methyltransferase
MSLPGQVFTAERIDPLFADSGSEYDRYSANLHVERYEFASKHVTGKLVVDCACGTGYGSALLARAGAREVVGVDIDGPAIAFARANHSAPRVSYHVADALQFQPSVAPDVWISLETVEHLSNPLGYLEAVHRRLAENGLLIASVPTTVSTDGNPFHRVDFTRRSWRRTVAAAGFQITNELIQEQRFSLGQILGQSRGERQQQARTNLLGYYLAHPGVAWARFALTVTRGFVNEYLTVVASRITR